MNDFERATMETLDRDCQMWELLKILGPDPNYWPLTIRDWAVESLVASLNSDSPLAEEPANLIRCPAILAHSPGIMALHRRRQPRHLPVVNQGIVQLR